MTETQACESTRPATGHPTVGHPDARRRAEVMASLRPLAIDVGVPLGGFYLLHDVLGISLWLSLALSSIPPAIRAVAGFAAGRMARPRSPHPPRIPEPRVSGRPARPAGRTSG